MATITKDVNENPWTEVVRELIRLTQQRKLEWRKWQGSGEAKAKFDDAGVKDAYFAQYLDRVLVVAKREYRETVYLGIVADTIASTEYTLDLIDTKADASWTVSDIRLVKDLYYAILYQAAKVKEFLDDFRMQNQAK
ncbi:MAG TPA: hypothetical protein VF707_07845 [Ardenticatenaceae bacterium]|jgi:hypothetical protein